MTKKSAVRIGELSELTGVPIPSIRKFQQERLIDFQQSAMRHFRYPAEAEEQVRQVQRFIDEGLSFEEIRERLGRQLPSSPDSMVTLGELSRLTEVTGSTLQYYEELGLIECCRSGTKRRLFHLDVVSEVKKIMHYRSLSIPLAQIRELQQWSKPPTGDRKEQREILQERLSQVAAYKSVFADIELQVRDWLRALD